MKDTNIVDSIAACVDKYTKNNTSKSSNSSRPLPTISKDLTQPLTVLTSNEKESSSSTSSSISKQTLGSPRKRHLLQMQNPDLAGPPTLEKEPENTKHLTEITKNRKNFVENDGKNSRDDKRPSSPPKLNRFDSDPPMPTLSTGRFLKYVNIVDGSRIWTRTI